MSAAASRRRLARVLGWALLLGVCGALRGATGQVLRDTPALLAEAEQLTRETPELFRAGRYQEALASARRALEIRESIFGPRHLETATSLNHMGVILQELGELEQARRFLERALAIRRERLEPDHPNLAESFMNLGGVLLKAGEIRNAIPLLEKAVEIYPRALGWSQPESLTSLTNLAFAVQATGDLQRAKSILEQVYSLRTALRGEADPATLVVLNNLGGINLELGHLAAAKANFERALELCTAVFGPEHPHTVQALNNLGGFFNEAGDLAAAKRTFAQALAVREKILPAGHPELAESLTNVGGILSAMGDAKGGRHYYERALAIHEKVYGRSHPMTAGSLSNVASQLMTLGDLSGARALLEEALQINEQNLGPDHPNTAAVLGKLGALLMDQGELERAREVLEHTLRIHEVKHGLDHPSTATSLANLGSLLISAGDRKGGRSLLERALAIQQAKLGDRHPDTVSSLHNLASVYELEGLIERAIELEERALEGQEQSVLALLSIGSESEKALYFRTLLGTAYSAVSLHARSAVDNPRALRLALAVILQHKGRVLDATVEGLRQARRSQDPHDRQLFERVRSLRESWAYLLMRSPEHLSAADRSQRIQELDQEIRRAAAELADRHPAYSREIPVTLDAVQARLAPGSALIELFIFKPWKPGSGPFSTWWEEPRYVAYVLRREGLPRWADLGLAEPIERAVEAFRRSVATLGPDALERGRELDALTMARIRPLLGDAEDLILSPDGALQLIPFAALVDEDGRYLVERFSLRYVTSGRDLLRFADAATSREPGLLLGDPDFEAMPEGEGEGRRSAEMGQLRADRLAGTGEEVRAIGALLRLPAERILTGRAASESAVKGAHGPQTLHIASHGFFLPDAAEAIPPAALPSAYPPPSIAEEPLLRSGLALSGYNRRQESSGADDGVLTALEMTDLDLWGTRLVVLSACETGLGDVRGGQGVFGLRRALALAGAQAQMMSLWQVADEPTKDLMVSWYGLLLQGAPKSEALRRIQLAALAGGPLPITDQRLRGARLATSGVPALAGSRHPYYWAGWILSGDPRPLDLGEDRVSPGKGVS